MNQVQRHECRVLPNPLDGHELRQWTYSAGFISVLFIDGAGRGGRCRLACRRRRRSVGHAGASQIQPQLGAELRLVDGGELGGRHDPGASSIGHVDDGPHDQRGVLTVLWHLCVALILKKATEGGTLLIFHNISGLIGSRVGWVKWVKGVQWYHLPVIK